MEGQAEPASADRELSTAQWREVIQQVQAGGFHHVHVFGGEPFLRADLPEIAEALHAADLPFNIATNGSLVTRDTLGWLLAANASLVVAVHGLAAFHDDFTGSPGAFTTLTRKIPWLLEAGVDITVATCLLRSNVGQYPELISLLARLGVRHFFTLHFSPLGRGEALLSDSLPPAAWYKLFQQLRWIVPEVERRVRHPVTVHFELSTFPTADPRRLRHLHQVRACTLPQHPNLCVDWAGNVYPCILFLNQPKWVLGNVRETPLETIRAELTGEWLESRVRRTACRACDYYEHCRGGCPAYALGMTHDYRCDGEKRFLPFCPLRPTRP